MKLDDRKSLALKFCIDIANDYTLEEVKKFTPPSVQKAWEVGQEFIQSQIKEDRKKLKGFQL